MSFNEILSGARDILAGEFGETVTYTPPGGAPVEIASAMWSDDEFDLQNSNDGEWKIERARVNVAAGDVAAPEVDAEVSRSSEGAGASAWTVIKVIPVADNSFDLHLERDVRHERTDGEYRHNL